MLKFFDSWRGRKRVTWWFGGAISVSLLCGGVLAGRALLHRPQPIVRPQLTVATRLLSIVPAPPVHNRTSNQVSSVRAVQSTGFGISAAGTLPGLTPAALAHRLDDYWALGVRWLRFDLVWADIQAAGPGSYNWADYDRVIAAAHARGFHLLAMTAYTPGWARSPGCNGDKCAPINPDDYARFVAAAASRYSPQGLHSFEIWNEENMRAFYRSSDAINNYANLLKKAYLKLKDVSPTNEIIIGGLGSTDTSDGNVAQLDYLNGLYGSGIHGYFDAIAYHPYSFPVLPSYAADWNAWAKMSVTPVSLRSIMTAHGDGAKSIWATEFGAPTNGPGVQATLASPELDRAPDHVDEALQAASATEAVRLWRSYAWAGPLFWYSFQDAGTDSDSTENFYGLVRADGSPKPAYQALKTALAQH